jgi:hypothetical protein
MDSKIVLILKDASDKYCVIKHICERSKELLTQADVACTAIEPADHGPFLGQPDQFVSTLQVFAESLRRETP